MYTHTTYSAEEFTVHPTSYRKKKKTVTAHGPAACPRGSPDSCRAGSHPYVASVLHTIKRRPTQ